MFCGARTQQSTGVTLGPGVQPVILEILALIVQNPVWSVVHKLTDSSRCYQCPTRAEACSSRRKVNPRHVQVVAHLVVFICVYCCVRIILL